MTRAPITRVTVAGLFVSGVLVFADDRAVAWAAAFATLVLLVAIGFAEGRLPAVRWAVVPLLSALAADVLWQLDWAPFDRSGDYEPLPQTPFVLIAVPVFIVVIAVGVGARAIASAAASARTRRRA